MGRSTTGVKPFTANAGTSLDVTSLPLPTGAATEATLADIKTATEIIDNFISGARGLVTEDNSAAIKTALEIIDNFISGNRGLVTEDNSAAILAALGTVITTLSNPLTVSGTVTANAGTNLNTSALALEATLQSVKTAVEIIDNAIAGSEMQVDIVAALPAGTNYIGKIRLTDGTTDGEVVPLAGFNAQAVAIVDGAGAQITTFGGGAQYTEGDTDATITGTAMLWEDAADTLKPVSTTTPLPVNIVAGSSSGTEYTEDAASVADPAGGMMMAVRKDTLAAITTTDGDNIALRATNKGELYVKQSDAIGIAGTIPVYNNNVSSSIQEDNVAVTNEHLFLHGGIRKDTPAGITDADNDFIIQRFTNYGAGYVQLLTSAGAPIDSVGGTEYTEDDPSAANPSGGMLMAVRADSPAAVTDTDSDNIAIRATNKGEVYVKHIDSVPVTGTFFQATQPVSLASVPSHAVTNAGTFAVQESGGGTISTNNSSTATLGIGAAFTGTADEVTNYSSVTVNVISNVASATDGLSIQQSSDGANWDITDVYTVPAATGKTFGVQCTARYLRVVYTNGGTGQGSFRLQTILHRYEQRTSSVRPQDARSNDNDFNETISYLSGYNGTTWDRLRSSTKHGLVTDTDNNSGTLFRGKSATFRTLGRAGTAGQKIMAIHNATGSSVTVRVHRIIVDLYATVVKAVTVAPPIVRIWKFTAVPTNGTQITKNKVGGTTTSNASVTVWNDSSADGTGSGTTLTVTLPAGTFIDQLYASRIITAVGEVNTRSIVFEYLKGIELAALEGLCVFLDYTAATSNPTTDMWTASIKWSEYTT